MPFSLGHPVEGTDSGLAVEVVTNGSSGSGILIDSTHVLTAAHVVDGQSGIQIKYLFGTSSVVTRNAVSGSVHDVQGAHTSDKLAGLPYDIAIFTLSTPVSLPTGSSFLGIGARVDGASLQDEILTEYGYPTQVVNNNGVTPGIMGTNSGFVLGVDNRGALGTIGPIPDTQQYGGMSGAGAIISDPNLPTEYITGDINGHAPSNFLAAGTYITPLGFQTIMNILKADEPSADANTLPVNYVFGSNATDTLPLDGSWQRDYITGGNLADTLNGHEGNDTIDGGGGRDIVDYANAFARSNGTSTGVHVDFVTSPSDPAHPNAFLVSNDGSGSTDLIQNVEVVRGSNNADTIAFGDPSSHSGQANVQVVDARSGIDTADFGAVTSPVSGTLTWDSGTPNVAVPGFPQIISAEHIVLTSGNDTFAIQGAPADSGYLSTVVVDGGAGNDTFNVTAGSGVAPVVLRGGDGGDVFNINANSSLNVGTPVPPDRLDSAGFGFPSPDAPRVLVIDGGAGTDTINLQGDLNLVRAELTDPADLSQLDLSKIASQFTGAAANKLTVVLVNGGAEAVTLDGHLLGGVAITDTVTTHTLTFSSDDASDGYISNYPGHPFNDVYVPQNYEAAFFQDVAVSFGAFDGLDYQPGEPMGALGRSLFVSDDEGTSVSMFGFRTGDAGLTITAPSSIPETIQSVTHYTIPGAPLYGNWDFFQSFYGGYVFTGRDPTPVANGSVGLQAYDSDGFAINPILSKWASTTNTISSSNDISGSSAVTLDLSQFTTPGEVGGTDGDDTITVSSDAKIYAGGAGEDTYGVDFTGSADHLDRIIEAENGGSADRVNLPSMFTTAGISFDRYEGSDSLTLVAHDGGATYQVFLQGEFAPNDAGVEQIGFASGDVWTKSDLVQAYFTAAQTPANDRIYGFSGNDTIPNGAGDDDFVGRQGDDTYSFSDGDGSDRIFELSGGGSDTLVFGAGLNVSDLHVSQFGGVYTLSFDGHDGQVQLVGEFNGTDSGVEQIKFADSTVWSKTDLYNFYSLHAATPGDDEIAGSAANDTLQGGEGDDTIRGGLGDDSYGYNVGDGADVIDERPGGGADTLHLGAGITPGTTTVIHTGDDDLTLSFSGGGSINLLNEAAGGGAGVEQIIFADNTTWSATDALNAAKSFLASGSSNADLLVGFDTPDSINGGAGDDYLDGGAGADTLVGGSGDDLLIGGTGNDQANFTGVATDYSFVRNADGSVTVTDLFGSDGVDQLYDVEAVHFGGDASTEAIDSLVGGYGATGDDSVAGTSQDDTLYGLAGNDTLAGGAGDDVMDGGAGNDLYLWGTGDGYDTVVEGENGGVDTLHLTAANPGDVTVAVDFHGTGVQLVIAPTGGGYGSVELVGQLVPGGTTGIESIVFADNTTWDRADIVAHLTSAFGGTQTINGTAGADTIVGNGGSAVLFGLEGNDSLVGANAAEGFVGGPGNDTMVAYSGGDYGSVFSIGAGDGVDVIHGDPTQWDTLDFSIFGSGVSANLSTGLYSGFGASGTMDGINDLQGGGGNDTLTGGGANDTLSGADGDDRIVGGSGDEQLDGGSGSNTIVAGTGSDAMSADAGGSNTFVVGAVGGHDFINVVADAGQTNVLEFGASVLPTDVTVTSDDGYGNDLTFHIGTGDHTVYVQGQLEKFGTQGSFAFGIQEIHFANGTVWTQQDLIDQFVQNQITSGNDNILGTVSGEVINGGSGNDTISAREGNDTVEGGAGNDVLNGGLGNNHLTGGAGADTFDLRGSDGANTITDFSAADGDQIELGSDLNYSTTHSLAQQIGSDVEFDFGDGTSLVIAGTTIASLQSSWFAFG